MDQNASDIEVIRRTWNLSINPGGAVAITKLDTKSAVMIAKHHRNKLITNEALLICLGSRFGRLRPLARDRRPPNVDSLLGHPRWTFPGSTR
jgi:hypothetical protein